MSRFMVKTVSPERYNPITQRIISTQQIRELHGRPGCTMNETAFIFETCKWLRIMNEHQIWTGFETYFANHSYTRTHMTATTLYRTAWMRLSVSMLPAMSRAPGTGDGPLPTRAGWKDICVPSSQKVTKRGGTKTNRGSSGICERAEHSWVSLLGN